MPRTWFWPGVETEIRVVTGVSGLKTGYISIVNSYHLRFTMQPTKVASRWLESLSSTQQLVILLSKNIFDVKRLTLEV